MAILLIFIVGFLPTTFLVIAVVSAARAAIASRAISSLERKSMTVQGHIAHFLINPHGRGGVICRVIYNYRYEGKTYTARQEVSRDHILAAGSEVQIRCLPQNPSVAMLTGDDRDDAKLRRLRRQAMWCFFLAVLIAIASWIIVSTSTPHLTNPSQPYP